MKRPAGLWVDVAEVTGCHRLWVEPNQALGAFPVSDHQAAGYFLVHQEEITTLKMDQHILGPTVHGRNDPSDDAPSECNLRLGKLKIRGPVGLDVLNFPSYEFRPEVIHNDFDFRQFWHLFPYEACTTTAHTLTTGQGDSRIMPYALVRKRVLSAAARPITTKSEFRRPAAVHTALETSPDSTTASTCMPALCCTFAISSLASASKRRRHSSA